MVTWSSNEKCPLIAENRASGDENEEYSNEIRFGPIETFPHRYHEATLRVLQMRRNFVWAEGGPWLVNPPLLHYLAVELGQTARTAPDAWCCLREERLQRWHGLTTGEELRALGLSARCRRRAHLGAGDQAVSENSETMSATSIIESPQILRCYLLEQHDDTTT